MSIISASKLPRLLSNRKSNTSSRDVWTIILKVVLRVLVMLIPAVLALGLWEGIVRLLETPTYILPKPSEIATTLYHDIGPLVMRAENTTMVAVIGGAVGSALALTLAWLVSRTPWLANPMIAYAVALVATPIMVTAPILYIWLGLEIQSKIILVALASMPIMFISGARGLMRSDQNQENLMRSYAAGYLDRAWNLYIPSALPSVFSGLKIMVPTAMIIAIVSDFFGGSFDFLGQYIRIEATYLHTANAWSAAVTAAIIGLVLYGIVNVVERVVLHWDFKAREL